MPTRVPAGMFMMEMNRTGSRRGVLKSHQVKEEGLLDYPYGEAFRKIVLSQTARYVSMSLFQGVWHGHDIL